MTNEEYMEESARTATSDTLAHAVVGVAGEAGELADCYKKYEFYGLPLDVENVKEEAGDILWYVAMLCRATGTTISEVMQTNIDKLRVRYPEQWSVEGCVRKVDHGA